MRLCGASIVVLFAFIGLTSAADQQENWWDSGITVVQRSLQECEVAKDVASCLKVKAVRAMDRALHAKSVPLFGGLMLVQRDDEARSSRSLPAVPRDATRRSAQLDDLVWGRISRFLETRSLQLSLPRLAAGVDDAFEGRYLADAQLDLPFMSEPRGKGSKLKKMAGPAILIMVMAAYKLAMMMAGVAMLSGKALIVSKIALTLAGVAVLKKLLSSHHDHEKTTVEIVKAPQVRRVSHSHSYSSAHEHDEHGYGEKSWTVGPMGGGYSHRSMLDDSMDSSSQQGGSPYLMPQDVASKRDFRTGGPAASPANFVTGRGVESLSIRSHDPLRIVVADQADAADDIRVHHRQRGLDMPVLPGPAGVPAFGATEEPIDYSQFGEADRGAWRGLGSVLMPASERSLRSAPSSEQQERSVDGSVNEETSNYHPRSLNSAPVAAA
ncbi:hypothetical protein ONE63_010087 [Megalurothrips usitatus]|uniref:Uncharacterized protein n=1 Tax=Megalurothrips usitatus TaxID=439358 RepID=A0AAV7XNN3_9NEOP|nr:hypothetical protein ONE63_010087 [Megalurothrips usitatus]